MQGSSRLIAIVGGFNIISQLLPLLVQRLEGLPITNEQKHAAAAGSAQAALSAGISAAEANNPAVVSILQANQVVAPTIDPMIKAAVADMKGGSVATPPMIAQPTVLAPVSSTTGAGSTPAPEGSPV